MTIQRRLHDWTEADDARLAQALMDLEPLREQYEERGVGAGAYWSAVAGRLVPEVLVTGTACRRRWTTLEERRKAAEQPAEPDAWAQVAARVEQYERELGDATYDEVRGVGERLAEIAGSVAVVRGDVKSIEVRIDRLLAELGVVP